jgi:chromosomal replication initiator protein
MTRHAQPCEADALPIPQVFVSDIQRAAATEWNLPLIDMVSERRNREIAWPRQAAMYLARELTPYSYERIGKLFGGRDHTTVLHAVHEVEKRLETDKLLAARLKRLRRRLTR